MHSYNLKIQKLIIMPTGNCNTFHTIYLKCWLSRARWVLKFRFWNQKPIILYFAIAQKFKNKWMTSMTLSRSHYRKMQRRYILNLLLYQPFVLNFGNQLLVHCIKFNENWNWLTFLKIESWYMIFFLLNIFFHHIMVHFMAKSLEHF